MFAFGGAMMVQDVPEQLKAGKMVREPMALPWVLETAMREEDTTINKREKRTEGREIYRPLGRPSWCWSCPGIDGRL
jgi:hypothetical protein